MVSHLDPDPANTAIDIAPFVPRFAPGVAQLIVPIQRDEFGFAITLEDQPDLSDIRGFYQQGDGNFWVALAAGDVVGSIALRDLGNGQGALRKMFVQTAYRGPQVAVAQRLLETLFDWCKVRGVREVFLGTTEAFRAAHRFYEKHGFQRIERAALPAAFPFMAVDTRFYRREV